MSIIARSRLRSALSRRFYSEAAANNHRESIVSSSTVLNNPPSPPSSTTPPPPSSTIPPPGSSSSGTDSKSWNFLKFSLIAALTGGASLTGYATYAYTLDEVEEKTKALRDSTKYTVKNDASSLDKIQASVYSGAMTVPAKLVELYIDLRKLSEEHVKGFTEPIAEKLLPDLHPLEQHVFTLVLDLTETLIYSDWKRERGWKTFKRPGLDAFLEQLSQYYEIVVYSDQLQMYVDPVIDGLDPEHKYIRYRLSRGATKYQNGKHYRDFSKLNRDPAKILYLSADALGCSLQPENGVPITPWKLEADDTALLDLIPFLEYVATHRPADIRPVLASYQGRDIAKEFIERTKEYQRRMEGKQGRLWRR